MSTKTKLTRDEEGESVDNTKYRGMIGTTHLRLWYLKGSGIETIVYADSDHAGDYVDRKSTNGVCTFMGCCLTSWFSKKRTALAISTTEAEYLDLGDLCGGTSEHDGREGERSRDQAGSGRNGQGSGQNGQESNQDSQGSSQGNGANGGGGGVPDFATIIAQQLQNLLPTIVAQVGNHVNNQGNNKNQDDNVTNDNNQGNVRTMNNGRGGCSYKEFMAYNLKEYDGKDGVIVYTCWIEKMESVQTRGRESIVGITWEDFKTLAREELCPNNEMQKLETEFWCHAMVGCTDIKEMKIKDKMDKTRHEKERT
ncbi:hypothetical protein Tco_0535464 [Tanacetum coccineum]